MVCRDFILPEPASYVSFFALFNLRNLLYLIVSKTAFLWNHHETQVDQKNRCIAVLLALLYFSWRMCRLLRY